MANIYKNAIITISAAVAADCGQGFLQDRLDVQLRLEKSICLPFMITTDEGTQIPVGWVSLCPDTHMGHKIKLFSEEFINTRAWTYQESTLASRLVIFGSGPPQWHCKKRWRICGLNTDPENLPSQECSSGTMKITVNDGHIVADQTLRYLERPEPRKDDIGLWLEWFPVLQNYSNRALSYRTDKLLALSALAKEHQSSHNTPLARGKRRYLVVFYGGARATKMRRCSRHRSMRIHSLGYAQDCSMYHLQMTYHSRSPGKQSTSPQPGRLCQA